MVYFKIPGTQSLILKISGHQLRRIYSWQKAKLGIVLKHIPSDSLIVHTLGDVHTQMARVILELKPAFEKGTTIKDVTGGATSTSSAPQMCGFGIGSFISSGGIVGKEQTMPMLRNEDVSLPSTTISSKICKECGTILLIKARFCSKCGKTQENT
jgi:hypothetical protein